MANPFKTLKSVVSFGKLTTDPVERRLKKCANVEDLRRIAKRRLPGGVFDYIDGGAEDELTLAANSRAFADTTFVPRVMTGTEKVDFSTTILGKPSTMPLIMAPTGFTRIAHSQGELAVARAAERAGVPYTLSTMGTRSIEEVRGASDGRLWYQVYAWRDKELVRDMVERAKEQKYEALMLTVDTAVLGRRERDTRRGFSLPPQIGPRTIIDGMVHPAWTWDFIRAEPIKFANVRTLNDDKGGSPVMLSLYVGSQFEPALKWSDVEWLRSMWDGKVIVKGIQCVDDAVIAAEVGADAIVLSNHGGRQLDSAPAILPLVAPVADAVKGRTEIYMDGGVRRGSDIVKAVAAGADAVMAGRPYLYALGAAGEKGVDRLLMWWKADMMRTMHLLGVPSLTGLSRKHITLPR